MNFLPRNNISERRDNWLIGLYLAFGVFVLGLAIFYSPVFLFGLVLMAGVTWGTFKEPMWTVMFLVGWWPFESFALKFVSDDLYVFARYFSEILIYLLVVVVIVGLLTGRYKRRATSVDLPFVLFLVIVLASIVLNTLPVFQAALGFRQIIRFVLLFFVVVTIYPRRYWVKRILIVIVSIAVIQGIIGIAQAVFGGALDSFLLPSVRKTLGTLQLTEGVNQFWDPGQRVFGTMGRYDRMGTYLAMALLMVLGFVYEGGKKLNWRWLALVAVVALPSLVLTYSRSAWFGLIIGALAISTLKRDNRIWIGVGLSAVFLGLFMALSGISGTLADVPRQTAAERLLEAFSYQRFRGEFLGMGRVYWLYHTPVDIVSDNAVSALFGWGPGQYGGGAVAALGNTRVYDTVGLPFGVYGTEGYIDNNWFSLWGETGILGMTFYLWFYLALLVTGWKVARSAKTVLTRAVASGYVGVSFAVALNAMLATFLEVRTLAPYLWILAALMVVLASREKLIET